MSLLSGIDSIRVINLAHRTDRMESFAKNHPFLQYSRVNAVYGKTLDLDAEIYKVFKNNIFGWKKNVMGCALSHYREWQKIANGDFGDRVLVLEDDAVLDEKFVEKWNKIANLMPSNSDLVFLGGVLPVNKPFLTLVTRAVNESFANFATNTYFGQEKPLFHFCAYSYIITKNGAKKLCETITVSGLNSPIDNFMMFYDQKNFKTYFTTPLLCECTQYKDPNYTNIINFDDIKTPLYDTDIQNSSECFFPKDIMRVSGNNIYGLDSICVVQPSHNEIDVFSTNNPFLAGKYDYFDISHSELTPEIKHLFRDNDYNWDPIEIERSLSHYNVWQKIAKGLLGDNVLILENHTILNPNFINNWNEIAHTIPNRADLIYIGEADIETKIVSVNSSFSKPKNMDNWAGQMLEHKLVFSTYILSKAGAEQICKLIERVGFLVKIDILMLYLEKPLNIHFAKPFVPNKVQMPIVMFDKKQRGWFIEQGWLEEIFDCDFIIHESSDKHNFTMGNTVFLLYQHFITRETVEKWIELNPGLNLFLIHLSDETCRTYVEIYNHPSIKKVFRNYWRPGVVGPKVMHIPLGYVKHSNKIGKQLLDRQYTWSFAGAMDRPLRKDILINLEKMDLPYKIHRTPTFGASTNLSENEYLDLLLDTKLVPCLPGFFNVECFRFYEALECGAIPIISLDTNKSYEHILSAPVKPPLYGCAGTNWELVKDLAEQGPSLESKCEEIQNWWKSYKVYLKTHIKNIIFSGKNITS